ncbi:MAG: hypothetical protein EOO77_42045 [Oxalobacteraceae bacterium]|nr:MAG: hypothetical protein EOO77_42045 [Oxalobacteraceae bacterium]
MAMLEPLSYADGATTLSGLVARPEGAARAAIVVYPTIMNATQAVKDKAAALAANGYIALIADFYGKQPSSRTLPECLAVLTHPKVANEV